MAIELLIKDAASQQGEKLVKIIGLLSAAELVKLMDEVSLKPNPRSPNVNKITKAITRTLETNSDLLQYKTKGILAAGKILGRSGKIYTIDFTTPSYGGILDGGHNFFAIIRVMLTDAVRLKYSSNRAEDKRKRKDVDKIKSWRDLIDRWATYGCDVRTLIESITPLSSSARAHNKIAQKLSFLLPIEVISPSEGTTDREVKDIIHEISVARNNNVQLKEVAIAQHKGSYEILKTILPEEVNSKVQWKSGENQCPIPPTKIVPLALLPLKKLEDADVLKRLGEAITNSSDGEDEIETVAFPPVKLMSMYTSTTACISVYSQVIDAIANLNDSGADNDGIVDRVINSLQVISDLPYLWDTIEYSFEDLFGCAVSGNEKKYAELSCNAKSVAKNESPTRFFLRHIPKGRITARAGFLTPLFMSVCAAFMAYDPMEEKVRWLVSPEKIANALQSPSKLCKAMMKDYVGLIRTVEYDPSKFGKAPMPYEALNNYGSFISWVNDVKRS